MSSPAPGRGCGRMTTLPNSTRATASAVSSPSPTVMYSPGAGPYCSTTASRMPGSRSVLRPRGVLGGRHQRRIAGGHVLLERAPGVGSEHRPLRLDELPELVVGLREPVDRVAGVAQRAQQVQQARRHLHAARVHGVLAGALVVVDGNALVAVGLLLQRQPALDEVAEGVEPPRHDVEDLVAVRVGELCRDRVGRDAAVELRQDDAHREQGARHSLLVGHPLVVVLEHRQGRQHGDVALPQPRDRLVGAAQREPSVGHQHHEIGIDPLQEIEALLDGGNRVDVPCAPFECLDERVDVIPIGIERAGNAREQGDLRGGRLPKPLCVVVGIERVDGLEGQVVVEVEQHVHGTLDRGLDRVGAERLAVEVDAREVEQPGVVLGAAELQVAVRGVEQRSAQVGDVEGRVRGPLHEQARPAAARFAQVLELRLIELQAAPEHVDHRVAGGPVQRRHVQRLDTHRPALAGALDAGELEVGEVDEGDPRHREVALIGGETAPQHRRREQGGRDRPLAMGPQAGQSRPHSCRSCRGSHRVTFRLLRRLGQSSSTMVMAFQLFIGMSNRFRFES